MKPRVHLWDAVGLGLIIEFASGIVYSNQTGGTFCLHPELEGVYVPLGNDTDVVDVPRLVSPENDLVAYFSGPKHRGTGATNGLDLQDADAVDAVLARYRLSDVVSVDRTRLRESHEAWVCVVIRERSADEAPSNLFAGFGASPLSGVLTWSNTD